MNGTPKNLKALYYFSILFPGSIVLICWSIFYSLDHWNHKYLPTISVTVIPHPESLIFGVGMAIESIVLLVLLFIRNLVLKAHFRNIPVTWKIRLLHLFFLISGVSSIAGLAVLANVTLKDNFAMHNLAASFFFFGSFIHYFITDSLFFATGLHVKKISEYLTYIIILFAFIYMMFLSRDNNTCKSIAAILQYFACIFIFVKIILIYNDMPHHFLSSRSRNNNNQGIYN